MVDRRRMCREHFLAGAIAAGPACLGDRRRLHNGGDDGGMRGGAPPGGRGLRVGVVAGTGAVAARRYLCIAGREAPAYTIMSCRYMTGTSETVHSSRSLVMKSVAPASRQVATCRASAGLRR